MLQNRADFFVVGSGLFGAVFAQQCREHGKTCVVVERRPVIGGNCHSTTMPDGIELHTHGPHVLMTNSERVWEYANRFAKFNHYVHRGVVAMNDGRCFPFPVNRITLEKMYGKTGYAQYIKAISKSRTSSDLVSFEDYCIAAMGEDVYYLFYRDYTFKQWGRDPKMLGASLAWRIPFNPTSLDDRYHLGRISGIPEHGYTKWMEAILEGHDVVHGVEVDCDYDWRKFAHRLVMSGPLDEFYKYDLGKLEYRSLVFQHEHYKREDYQGVAHVNHTGSDSNYTRVLEWKHFTPHLKTETTWITKERAVEWGEHHKERYYPIDTSNNRAVYAEYRKRVLADDKIIVGGRLANYRYMNMDQVIAEALATFARAID